MSSKVVDLCFSDEQILSFFESAFGEVDQDKRSKFFNCSEVQLLSKLPRANLVKGLIAHFPSSWTIPIKYRDLESSIACWETDDGILMDDSEVSPLWLLMLWIETYGILSENQTYVFLKRSEVRKICEFPIEIIRKHLVENKKLVNLHLALMNLPKFRRMSDIEIDNRVNSYLQTLLGSLFDKELAECRKIQKERQEEYSAQVLRNTKGYYGKSISGSDMYSCQQCGMVIGLFNNHEC